MERSGRTGRMLDEAISLARNRKRVRIVALNLPHLAFLKEKLFSKIGSESLPTIEFTTIFGWQGWRWEIMAGWNVPANMEVLVDHYTIEEGLRDAIVALHRFDVEINDRVPGIE